jgi:hypothetical protein
LAARARLVIVIETRLHAEASNILVSVIVPGREPVTVVREVSVVIGG